MEMGGWAKRQKNGKKGNPRLQEVTELAPFSHPEGIPDDIVEPRGSVPLNGLPGHHPPEDTVRRLLEHAIDAQNFALRVHLCGYLRKP